MCKNRQRARSGCQRHEHRTGPRAFPRCGN
jgi:hypothetical protein